MAAAKAVIAALGRCAVACRCVEPKGVRFARQGLPEPRPHLLPLTQVQVHLMLLVGQYELSPAPVLA